MHAIIFADRRQHGLSALAPELCPALLPIAGKTVIEYTLEELADAGITQATVFIGPNASELRALLGQGERWGLDLHFAHSRGDECPASLLHRLPATVGHPRLVLRGDELRSHAVASFLNQAKERSEMALAGIDSDGTVGMALSQSPDAGFTAALCGSAEAVISLPMLNVLRLDQAASVFAANQALLDGSLPGPLRAGINRSQGLRTGYQAIVSPQQVKDGQAYIGDRSELHDSVELHGSVVVGADSFVDRDAVLQDCIVLPGTYVGAGLHIRDAIVSPRGLLRVSNGQHIKMEDPLWLSPMMPTAISPLNERLLALLFAILCLPLSPWAFGRKAIRGLGQVIGGRLRLFGTRDRAGAAANASLPPSTQAAPRGLISLAHLLLPPDAPAEEHELTDAVYAQTPLRHQLHAALCALCKRASKPLNFKQGLQDA